MMIEIGNRLKELRENNNIKQFQVADALHISQQNYSRYENGHVEFPLNMLVQLADYFDVSVDYLLGRSMTQIVFDVIKDHRILDHSVFDVLNDLNSLTTDQKKSLFDYLGYLKSQK